MKKPLVTVLATLSMLFSMSSCALEEIDTPEERLKNDYIVSWIKRHGLIDPKQDWNLATRVRANVNPQSFGNGYTVCIYNTEPMNGGVVLARVSNAGEIDIDAIEGSEYLYVRAYDRSGVNYYEGTYPVVDGKVEIKAAASRAGMTLKKDEEAVKSRAYQQGENIYQWILACEDLGSSDDTDFNDVVLGVTYLNDQQKLQITPLAAGGVLETVVCYNDNELFETHQRLGGAPAATGRYDMINTYSWTEPAPESTYTINDVSNFTITENMGNISVKVKNTNATTSEVKTTIKAPTVGEAPQIICVPGFWEWPKERSTISDTYPEFTGWNANSNTNGEWYKKPVANKYIVRTEKKLDNATISLNVNGTSRNFVLYVPQNVVPNAPMVISLHGAGDNVRAFTTEVADQVGCIVAYPQGVGQNFPVFGGTVNGWWADGMIDNASDNPVSVNTDLEFFKSIIGYVDDRYSVDLDRVYLCGFSNGGMMTYACASMASDIFAAYAAISGFPLNEFHHRTVGSRPVPFLHIHGLNDHFVDVDLLPQIIDNMIARNGCDPVPYSVSTGSTPGGGSHTGYTKTVYKAQSGVGFDYTYYAVAGMGHEGFTKQTEDGNSALTMWNFFKNYTRKSTCDRNMKWSLNPDRSGFNPSQHNWQVLLDGRYLSYGTAKASNNADHNVYNSLQFLKGKYYFAVNTQGVSGRYITLQLQNVNNPNDVLFTKKVPVGIEHTVVVPFEVTADYKQFRLVILKDNASDKFTNLTVYSTDAAISASNGVVDGTRITEPTLSTQLSELIISQGIELDDFTRATMESGSGYTTFTPRGELNIAIKMVNVDIAGYDNILIKFAEPTPSGWHLNFSSNNDNNISLPAGVYEYRYEIPSDVRAGGTLPQICMLTLWPNPLPGPTKVIGIYKEKSSYTFNAPKRRSR